MAKIYRTTDKICYKIGEIEIKISPLSVHNKSILADYMTKGSKGDQSALIEGSKFCLKAAIKEVSGLEDIDGKPYVLEFDSAGYVTDNCIDDLLNIEESTNMIQLCTQLIGGVPKTLPTGVSLIELPKK